jgi:hypothetical protein
MYELKKKIGKVFTSKFVGTGPLSYEKRIYRAACGLTKVEKHCSMRFFGSMMISRMQHFLALGSTCADNRYCFCRLNSVVISVGHDSATVLSSAGLGLFSG